MLPPHPYLYLRGLRQVDHTVFCVANGQKTYWDPVINRPVPYSSGQQVKRTILDLVASLLGEGRAPITFNWEMKTDRGKTELSQKEPWSPCDPTYADQLVGGWMRAKSSELTIKRRSPLSISAMRPLHPTLAGLADESLTFDRSGEPQRHKVEVRDSAGNEVPSDKVFEFLRENQRTLPLRIWIPEDKVGKRAAGLFVYDVAIDMRTLFCVSVNNFEPELAPGTEENLLALGWAKSADGARLICPKARRDEIIPALAHSLIEWRITSNQARTYSPQNTLAVAIGGNANRIGAAIRADLVDEESERLKAEPVLEPVLGVELFTAVTAQGYIRGVTGSVDALEQAEKYLIECLSAFDYDV